MLPRNGDWDQPEVCFQVKNALEISEVYSLRAKLHRAVYQHRIANVAEAMVTDIFLAADPHFRLRGGLQRTMALSEAAHDVEAFARLNDSILDTIDLSPNEDLYEAIQLIERLKKRDFYQQIGSQIVIETLPKCHCGQVTRIEHKFCPGCGKSTITRNRTAVLKDGLCKLSRRHSHAWHPEALHTRAARPCTRHAPAHSSRPWHVVRGVSADMDAQTIPSRRC